jgi:hypothetical protein
MTGRKQSNAILKEKISSNSRDKDEAGVKNFYGLGGGS